MRNEGIVECPLRRGWALPELDRAHETLEVGVRDESELRKRAKVGFPHGPPVAQDRPGAAGGLGIEAWGIYESHAERGALERERDPAGELAPGSGADPPLGDECQVLVGQSPVSELAGGPSERGI